MNPIRRTVVGLLALLAASVTYAQDSPLLAAASDLRFALDEVIREYQQRTGKAIRVTYGSSGTFHRQLQTGSLHDMFLSADEDYVLKLADTGLTVDRGALYGIGRLVLFVPKDSRIKPDPDLKDLRASAADGRLSHLSIAHPDHAPYGRAAVESMKALGAWSVLQPKMVFGENVSQAAQYVSTGNAQAGIIAYSLVLAPSMANAGSYVLIPESLHAPLRQRMVLTKRAGPAARDFYEHMQQPEARAVLQRYGFALPPQPAK